MMASLGCPRAENCSKGLSRCNRQMLSSCPASIQRRSQRSMEYCSEDKKAACCLCPLVNMHIKLSTVDT